MLCASFEQLEPPPEEVGVTQAAGFFAVAACCCCCFALARVLPPGVSRPGRGGGPRLNRALQRQSRPGTRMEAEDKSRESGPERCTESGRRRALWPVGRNLSGGYTGAYVKAVLKDVIWQARSRNYRFALKGFWQGKAPATISKRSNRTPDQHANSPLVRLVSMEIYPSHMNHTNQLRQIRQSHGTHSWHSGLESESEYCKVAISVNLKESARITYCTT